MHLRIAIGTDHAGYTLKETLKKHLMTKGIDVMDVGVFSEEPTDYPVIAKKIAGVILTERIPGVFLGGSGLGECMAGNKIPGIRAARCGTTKDAVMARRHNDANMLNLGGRMVNTPLAKKIVDSFLKTPFDGDVYQTLSEIRTLQEQRSSLLPREAREKEDRRMRGAQEKFGKQKTSGIESGKEDGKRHIRRVKMLHELDGYPYP